MKLLIADDHALFRDALVQYIERSDPMSSITLAKDFTQAIDILEQNPHQNLVILDLRMPGMDGLNGFKLMQERFPDIPVALMSGIAEPHDVEEALQLGAVGYFPKTMSGKALLSAIQQVVSGKVFVPEGKDGEKFMSSYYADPDVGNSGQSNELKSLDSLRLTPRENEVLTFLVEGASNKDIARALDLQVVTVKLHVRGICRKMSAKNRTQAALMGKAMGVKPFSNVG
ncbi:MAG: DNA-binding response regulator [Zetaproteobacteria bacterium]|nr:MAG: DNA-binding response regulator [Zetaproteobacteria bacterium]